MNWNRMFLMVILVVGIMFYGCTKDKEEQSRYRKMLRVPTPFPEEPTFDPQAFVLQTEFPLPVSELYNHGTSLSRLANQINRDNIYLDDNITDEHFSKVTDRLIPGKTYTAKIFQISSNNVSSEECLAFLKSQNALLVGAQGLTLTWRHGRKKFPKGKWLVSFDQEDALWNDDTAFGGKTRVPYVFCIMDRYWYFHLGYFDFYWIKGHHLLCICD